MIEEVTVLNFSHPLMDTDITTIGLLFGRAVRVIDIPVQFDTEQDFDEQVYELMKSIPLAPEEFQTLAIVVNPPALSSIAVLVIAALHGRMGYFPPIIRMARRDGMPPRFEVAEIIQVQRIRDAERMNRA